MEAEPIDNTGVTQLEKPVFAQPHPTPAPAKFEIKHPSDNPAYKKIDELNREHKIAPLPFPAPRGLPEPKLTLAAVLDTDAGTLNKKIETHGQLVFHAAGDTGSTRGPESQNLVSDKMVNDFTDEEKEQPLFLFHLGDVIYSFGEAQYYYDQFYEPYRDYPAPILALAGNHDGMVAPGTSATSLAAFLENFCAETFEVTSEAGGLARTAQIQPGVFFTFEAPLIRILALYSNTLEDPGVIASPTIGTSQLTYLETALNRVKSDKFDGALILAHHHPAYTAGGKHGWSQEMLSQIDEICSKTGVVMQDLREWLVRVSRKDRARRLSWQFQILSESWNEAFSAASRRGKFDCACCAFRRRRGKVANDILGNVVLAGPRPGSPCLMPQRRSVLAPITTSI
ncbi:hypothetical protein AOQ71_05050 [Bradyrhizobium manausense]|uniref:Calcineurin-like phosphoesterase domain-containing protein n=1 Tax=Bradyrhizobium manausense TaxID=989370 RepID=A0A0R3E293_9BRAD|nr:hypothetical protein AOQ71_05050 [Bradyrhizobium manausense]